MADPSPKPSNPSEEVEALISAKVAASTDKELSSGDSAGEYQIENQLGAGGFGTVYKAVHPLIGKSAAVKVLNREFSSNPQMVSRFISEARAANTIRHANIIDVFSFGTLEDGRHYYVMELLDGLSLDQFIAERAPLEPPLLCAVLRGVARALDAAHGKGIVHRDLKPDNIFLSFDDDGKPVPKLLDFGIAKLVGDNTISGHKTRTGTPVGTPHYMSPEQCLGQTVDHRCDVYAFGVVCFEALAGKPPFDGQSYLELMNKQAHAERPSISAARPELGEHFDAPLKRMMARERDERPQSVAEAFDELVAAAKAAGYDVDDTPAVPSEHRRANKPLGKQTPSQLGNARTVADPASGATSARSGIAESMSGERTRRGPLLVVGGALVLAVAVYFLLGGKDDTADAKAESTVAPPPTSVVGTAPPTVGPTVAPAASTAAPAPVASTIVVTIETKAPKAEVLIDDKPVGSAMQPIELPPSDAVRRITVTAPGYQPKTLERRLKGGEVLVIEPDKIAPKAGKVPGKAEYGDNPY